MSDTREQIASQVITAVKGVTAGAKAATDRTRQLVSDWQANGNSRALGDPSAEVWQSCARDLLTLLDRIDAEMGVQR